MSRGRGECQLSEQPLVKNVSHLVELLLFTFYSLLLPHTATYQRNCRSFATLLSVMQTTTLHPRNCYQSWWNLPLVPITTDWLRVFRSLFEFCGWIKHLAKKKKTEAKLSWCTITRLRFFSPAGSVSVLWVREMLELCVPQLKAMANTRTPCLLSSSS